MSENERQVGIGLDFGTTNSAVGIAQQDGSIELINFDSRDGITTTYRSVLYFPPRRFAVSRHQRYSGALAIEEYLAADQKGRLIQSLKSFLVSKHFRETNLFGRQYSLEDLISFIISDLLSGAKSRASLPHTVVVGRPVSFSEDGSQEKNDFALTRLRSALKKAGLEHVIFEYEPVAAAYFYESGLDHDELIMIADFGGGTSDFCVLHVGPTRRRNGESSRVVLGTAGVPFAGDAFDAKIIRYLVAPALGKGSEYRSLDKILPLPAWVYSNLEKWHYLSFLKDSNTLSMLRSIQRHAFQPDQIQAVIHLIENDLGFYLHRAVQKAKAELSDHEATVFRFDDYPVRIEATIRRSDFENWIQEELEKINSCVEDVLEKAGVSRTDIDRVFLTGGSSFIPALRGIFEKHFGSDRIVTGEVFTSVAKGLALRALDLS
jgi:hypothetical chaperone protein